MLEDLDEKEGHQPLTITAAVATHRTTVVHTTKDHKEEKQTFQEQKPQEKQPEKEQQLSHLSIETTSETSKEKTLESEKPEDHRGPTPLKGPTEGRVYDPIYPNSSLSTNTFIIRRTNNGRKTNLCLLNFIFALKYTH